MKIEKNKSIPLGKSRLQLEKVYDGFEYGTEPFGQTEVVRGAEERDAESGSSFAWQNTLQRQKHIQDIKEAKRKAFLERQKKDESLLDRGMNNRMIQNQQALDARAEAERKQRYGDHISRGELDLDQEHNWAKNDLDDEIATGDNNLRTTEAEHIQDTMKPKHASMPNSMRPEGTERRWPIKDAFDPKPEMYADKFGRIKDMKRPIEGPKTKMGMRTGVSAAPIKRIVDEDLQTAKVVDDSMGDTFDEKKASAQSNIAMAHEIMKRFDDDDDEDPNEGGPGALVDDPEYTGPTGFPQGERDDPEMTVSGIPITRKRKP